jgi:hypothetical protein
LFRMRTSCTISSRMSSTRYRLSSLSEISSPSMFVHHAPPSSGTSYASPNFAEKEFSEVEQPFRTRA